MGSDDGRIGYWGVRGRVWMGKIRVWMVKLESRMGMDG